MESTRYFSLNRPSNQKYYIDTNKPNRTELRSAYADRPQKVKEYITDKNGKQYILRRNPLRYQQVSQVPRDGNGDFCVYDKLKNADRIEISGSIKKGKVNKLKTLFLGVNYSKDTLVEKLNNILKKCESGEERLAPQTIRFLKKSAEHLIK